MYISRSHYGRRDYIKFDTSPHHEVYFKYYRTWKASWGFKGEIVYYTHWAMRTSRSTQFWSLTRKGVRRKIAKWLLNHKKADRKYRESVEVSR